MTDLSGQDFCLETRLCECGCGLLFKVLAKSPQRFASNYHDRKGKIFDIGLMATVTKEYHAQLVNRRLKAKLKNKMSLKKLGAA